MIYLTSFFDRTPAGDPWSAARYQPQAFSYPVADWAQPVRPDGSAIKLRDFGGDLTAYSEYMWALLDSRQREVSEWLDGYPLDDRMLACWCPHTRVAGEQLAEFGTFHCHLGVVGKFLVFEFNLPIWYGARHRSDMTWEGL